VIDGEAAVKSCFLEAVQGSQDVFSDRFFCRRVNLEPDHARCSSRRKPENVSEVGVKREENSATFNFKRPNRFVRLPRKPYCFSGSGLPVS
jgi:hypothetical protein